MAAPSRILAVALAIAAFLSTATDASGRALTLFVAPDGRDDWSGRLAHPNATRTDGPLATLSAACKIWRELAAGRKRTIVFQAGDYFLDVPLTLTDEDNGLTLEPAPGAQVRLYGGRRVQGWKRDGDAFYTADLAGVREGTRDFRALIVNGRYCPRARLPETGTFEHVSVFDVPWMTTTGGGWKRKPTDTELTTMEYKPNDLGSWLDLHNAEVTVYHMWDESLVGLSTHDPDTHTLTFSTPSGHPPGAFGVKKYAVWNLREGMTKPGQWYLDRTRGKVVYWPLAGEDMARAEVIAPTVESILVLGGTKESPVKDITIRNLTLSVTTTPLKAGGFGAGRFEGAVTATFAENCTFAGLEVVNVGGQAIKVSGSNCRIQRCHTHHVGACGIRFHGTGMTIADNHAHDIGLTYPSAIALTGGGRDCAVSHNHVHHTPYSAVTCGGQNNRIEANRIHHAMQELHDGAGIYCFAGKGLVLRGNYIHDILDTGGYGASAYYLDERSEDCLVEGNLSVNVARPSHNHMALNNTICHNVFLTDGDMRLTFPRSGGYTFEKNVLRAGGKITFDNYEAITSATNNILFSTEGKIECRKLDRYSGAGTYTLEPTKTNLQQDPMLTIDETGKIEYAPTSPTHNLNITPINVTEAGPRP